jgi:hypothetical protein
MTCKRAHRADVEKCFVRAGIGEVVRLLQAIDPQHYGQWKRRSSAIRTNLRMMRFHQTSSVTHGTTAAISAKNILASCASSWPHNQAMQNPAGPSEHSSESLIQACRNHRVIQSFLMYWANKSTQITLNFVHSAATKPSPFTDHLVAGQSRR